MPNNIYHKRNANPGVVPTAAQLTVGEIALNTADGKAYTRTTAGTVVELTEASVADGGEQFTPLDIANLALWLDASDISTLTLNGSGVSEWRDKSPTKSVWVQATTASQPISGTQTINGRNVLAFDGTNDWLSAVTPLPTAMPLSMFIVQRIVAGTSFGMTYTADVNGFNVRQTGAIVGALSIVPGNFNLSVLTRVGVNDVISLVYPTSGNNGLFLNGAPLPLNDATTRPTLAGTHAIGIRVNADGSTSFPANVRVAEIIAYNAALTATQRQRVERYLASKWGITAAPQVSNLDAQDWLNRVYQNNGTVSQSTAAAVNTFCNAINAAGLRDRFYRLNLFCGDNLAACLVPLYRGQSLGGTQYGNTTDTNNNFTASDYNERGATGGLKGNGSSKYLDTGVLGSALTTNNLHFGFGLRATQTGSAAYKTLGGVYNGISTAIGMDVRRSDAILNCLFGDVNAGESIQASSLAVGDVLAAWPSFYRNGVVTGATASTGVNYPSGHNIFIFGLNYGPSNVAVNHTDARMNWYSVGLTMTPAQALAYYNATQAFQTTLARNV